jgi:hypothetical protein
MGIFGRGKDKAQNLEENDPNLASEDMNQSGQQGNQMAGGQYDQGGQGMQAAQNTIGQQAGPQDSMQGGYQGQGQNYQDPNQPGYQDPAQGGYQNQDPNQPGYQDPTQGGSQGQNQGAYDQDQDQNQNQNPNQGW